MMRTLLLLLAITLVSLGAASLFAQNPSPSPVREPGKSLPGPSLPGFSGVTPPTLPAAEKTIDQLLNEVEQLRVQKAELAKREQELLKEVRLKLEKQAERVNRLGIAPSPPATLPPANLEGAELRPASDLPRPGRP
jgi:hypothetical protein